VLETQGGLGWTSRAEGLALAALADDDAECRDVGLQMIDAIHGVRSAELHKTAPATPQTWSQCRQRLDRRRESDATP
jgi:hypothetical protein